MTGFTYVTLSDGDLTSLENLEGTEYLDRLTGIARAAARGYINENGDTHKTISVDVYDDDILLETLVFGGDYLPM